MYQPIRPWWIFLWACEPGADHYTRCDGAVYRKLCGRLFIRNPTRFHVRLEFDWHDMWVGFLFRFVWKLPDHPLEANHASIMYRMCGDTSALTPCWNVWLGFLPGLSLHFIYWGTPAKVNEPKKEPGPGLAIFKANSEDAFSDN